MTKPERSKTMLRLNPETHQRVKEIAEECGRSFNNMVEFWINQAIKRNDWLDDKQEPPTNRE